MENNFKIGLATFLVTVFAFAGCEKDKEVTNNSLYNEEDYAVDLGLTSGTKWAKMNIGAEAPWNSGSCFAWGETEHRDDYSKPYVYENETKYQVDDKNYNGSWYKGTFIGDNKKTLDATDDVAKVNWGGDWRIPTKDDFQELLNNCTTEFTDNYNNTSAAGVVFRNNNNEIFLPVVGHYVSEYKINDAPFTWYISASLETTLSMYTLFITNTDDTTYIQSYTRFWGLPIRPICSRNGDTRGHTSIDLGLPSGNLWATCNVGANKPQDTGDYYAWGETSPKENYDISTYVFVNEEDKSESSINKYQTEDGYKSGIWYKDVVFIGDNKNTLEAIDDAATSNWGGNWKMPTKEQIQELLDECYWVYTPDYNHTDAKGYIVYKAKNDNDRGVKTTPKSSSSDYSLSDTHIFLPALNSSGCYWSSSLSEENSSDSYSLYFYGSTLEIQARFRSGLLSVRPVCKP